MVKYHCLNPIAQVGLDVFDEKYEKTDCLENADVALVRSAAMHEMEFPESLLAVARAGAGVNNIPLDRCAEQGIVVFNTPGANANGVKELVIAGMLLAARDIKGGIDWVQTIKDDENVAKLVEKGKSKFAGSEIRGKKLGVIGLGAIGVLVANAALELGMTVYGCDPYISVANAWKLNRGVIQMNSREDVFKECDYITVHTPLLDDTRKMINRDTIAMMKDGVVILNYARDLLVDDDAMEEALASGKVARYMTDFPNAKSAGMKGAIATPHLGASTQESEDNCAIMAVKELRDYVENGNIANSVNYPALDAGVCRVAGRICIQHRNIPNMLSQFTTTFANLNINIENMYNKSRGDYAYSVLDVCDHVGSDMIAKLSEISGVLKVRLL